MLYALEKRGKREERTLAFLFLYIKKVLNEIMDIIKYLSKFLILAFAIPRDYFLIFNDENYKIIKYLKEI